MAGGASFSPGGTAGDKPGQRQHQRADRDHLFPGAVVYRTPQQAYLAARLWRATGVKALQVAEGTVFTEINPAARLGGYTLAKDAGEMCVNNRTTEPGELPPGLEIIRGD